jgi:hypothetical protein
VFSVARFSFNDSVAIRIKMTHHEMKVS